MFLGPHELQRSEQREQPALVVLQVTLRDQIAAQIRPLDLDVLIHLLAGIPQLTEAIDAGANGDVFDAGRARIVSAAAICQQFVGICPCTEVGPRNEVRASFVNHLLTGWQAPSPAGMDAEDRGDLRMPGSMNSTQLDMADIQ